MDHDTLIWAFWLTMWGLTFLMMYLKKQGKIKWSYLIVFAPVGIPLAIMMLSFSVHFAELWEKKSSPEYLQQQLEYIERRYGK